MSSTILKPENRKAIQCPLCQRWVTLQGYGGHIRFYHDGYEKKRKSKLFNRLVGLHRAGKITERQLSTGVAIVGAGTQATTGDIDMIEDTIERWGTL